MSWCTIESDPGVFSEIIANLGVKGVSVEEIYSLEESEQQREPSYGLIFLFKYKPELERNSTTRPLSDDETPSGLFFSKQIVQNACATQAILSVLLNQDDAEVDLGEDLREFKAFSTVLDSESRGYAIGESDKLRLVHNAFARQESFLQDDDKDDPRQKKGDAYHFVAYVPYQGQVYEIDGLKPGPVLHGAITSDWLQVAKPAIEARMQRYASSETHFALLTVRPSRSVLLQQEIQVLQERLTSMSIAEEGDVMMSELRSQLDDLQSRLSYELSNQERQRQENIRRKHNYIPFVMTLLRLLAKKGLLQGMIDNAKTRSEATVGVKRKLL